MTKENKILLSIIAVLLILLIIMGVCVESGRLDNTIHKEAIREANAEIVKYNIKIDSLDALIGVQRIRIDSLNKVKQNVIYVTISEIDSVKALPFGEKGAYFVDNIEKLKHKQEQFK